jgi:hypothetical protein
MITHMLHKTMIQCRSMAPLSVNWRATVAAPVCSIGILPATDTPVISAPQFHYDAHAEGWQTSSGFDMPAAFARYSTDRQTLQRYYSTRHSHERQQAFHQFTATWLEVLTTNCPSNRSM